ncbi:ABC-type transport auxiliary lipoprotein family protein [Marinicauda salina]|nr:ABC-type transport auxiliary lipoprotein family protein [Marinicauda salina]
MIYRLAAPEEAREVATRLEGASTVAVREPIAPRALAGNRIALMREGRIAYLSGADWISPVPRMVHAMILDAFNADQADVAAVRPEEGVLAGYDLNLELRRFEAVYDGGSGDAPLVMIRLRARIVDSGDRTLVAGRLFEQSRRASANRQGAIVDAFSEAAWLMSEELAAWTADEVVAAGQTPPTDPDEPESVIR